MGIFEQYPANLKGMCPSISLDQNSNVKLTRQRFKGNETTEIPNFTIIPKEKSGVILDKRMLVNENDMAELSKEKEDIMKLWIDGVYVGAAYIAAGLVAA